MYLHFTASTISIPGLPFLSKLRLEKGSRSTGTIIAGVSHLSINPRDSPKVTIYYFEKSEMGIQKITHKFILYFQYLFVSVTVSAKALISLSSETGPISLKHH